MMYTEILIPILLLIIAFLYASVGHGGASGYLAILSIYGVSSLLMKSSSLILNILVSLIAFYHYYKSGYFDWRLFFAFAITSIPFAFIGAWFPLDDVIYKKILGIFLVFPILKLTGVLDKDNYTKQEKSINWYQSLLIGAIIGLLSGMIGIGGGIILTPLILLFGWAGMKKAAAVSALFIFVNSLSGFISLYIKGISFDQNLYIWILMAVIGGWVGSYLGSKKFNTVILRYILAVVLSIASLKLLFI